MKDSCRWSSATQATQATHSATPAKPEATSAGPRVAPPPATRRLLPTSPAHSCVVDLSIWKSRIFFLQCTIHPCHPSQHSVVVPIIITATFPISSSCLHLNPDPQNRPAVTRFAHSDSSSFHLTLKHALWNVRLLTLHSFPSLYR